MTIIITACFPREMTQQGLLSPIVMFKSPEKGIKQSEVLHACTFCENRLAGEGGVTC